MVGRRKTNHHLPKRVYLRHGAYWYAPKSGRPVRLATEGEFNSLQLAAMAQGILVFNYERHCVDLYRVMRRSASCRGLEVTLTLDDVKQLLKEANYRCTLTGILFSGERIPGVRVRPWIPSIDRLDNSKGYVAGNCRVVCAYVNIAINAFGIDAFKRITRSIRRNGNWGG